MQTQRIQETVTEVNGFVLLVEDNEDDIVLTRRALNKVNEAAQLLVARDGLEAVDLCFGGVPNRWTGPALGSSPFLILLDLKIPKLGGLEVYECFRSEPLTKDVPIVILSASHEEMDLLEARGLGADAYINKPLNPRKLAELLSRFSAATR